MVKVLRRGLSLGTLAITLPARLCLVMANILFSIRMGEKAQRECIGEAVAQSASVRAYLFSDFLWGCCLVNN